MNIFLSDKKIALDNSNGDISFVSHAHADHLNGVKSKPQIISTEETKLLGNLKGEIISLENTKLLEAGHMLGSKQLLVEQDGKITVYTGDLRLKSSIMFKGAEIPQVDELIIEATYGNPYFRFDSSEIVYSEIEKWVKENKNYNLLIGAYEMGKSQEVIKILNEYASVIPVVNEKIANLSRIYNMFGKKLKFLEVGTPEAEEVMKDPFVAVVPMRHAKKYFAQRMADAFSRKTLAAAATGWIQKFRMNVDKGFSLSDHADFHDLKYYIENSGAKKVSFFCGDSSHLEKEFKSLL